MGSSELPETGDEAVLLRIRGVTHDLATLLTSVHGGVELAGREHSPEQRLRWLDTARLACERAFELVQQLSQLADGQELAREAIDPGDALGDVISLVRDVSSPDISFSFRQQDTRPIVANRGQLGQVALNLLFNARDAVVERAASEANYEPRVLVSLFEAAVPGSASDGARAVLVQVMDNGTGMAPELVKRVFEPLVTTKPPGKGSGLGLSTTRRIVKEHGGGVSVESTPGAGTTFTVWFPVA